ncbi:Keratin-associated protein 15-1 [Heterocephalus glaber]|uniref:Keratin-associated protein n=1 Tax=Heterocephalus glaber TaxID=10181 RepID=G5AZV2_HETGA|nr:keratin-associated protein 15-1 [Heterocephalus glaber]EHB02563.1 Keratin-associated protein 15-1 [Heterocephalus glaber]
MSYNFSSGNFSSQSFGGFLRPTVSAYNSVYPTNVIIPLKTYQLGSSIYSGQQESFCEPIGNQTSCTGTRSFQTSCFHPSNSISFRPCQTNYTGSLGYGNTGLAPFGHGNTVFGCCGHRNTGFRYLGNGSSFYRPSYFSTRSFQ